jgi:hypothetical protein
MSNNITWIGLGGTSHGPLTLALHIANKHPDITFVLVDGKDYRPSQADHEFFLKNGPKPIVQALLLESTYPTIKTIPIKKFVARTTTNRTISAHDLIKDGDYVLLGVDNHETRRLISDHAQTLKDTTIISGAIDGDDVHVWVHLRRNGTDITRPPLQRYPDINAAPKELPQGMLRRAGCLETTTTDDEGRPNYFALITATTLMLNALSLILTLDATGQANEFPYDDAWFNVRNATAATTRKER